VVGASAAGCFVVSFMKGRMGSQDESGIRLSMGGCYREALLGARLGAT